MISFKKFDMTEYYNVLEEYKDDNSDNLIKYYGNVDKYDEFMKNVDIRKLRLPKML